MSSFFLALRSVLEWDVLRALAVVTACGCREALLQTVSHGTSSPFVHISDQLQILFSFDNEFCHVPNAIADKRYL